MPQLATPIIDRPGRSPSDDTGLPPEEKGHVKFIVGQNVIAGVHKRPETIEIPRAHLKGIESWSTALTDEPHGYGHRDQEIELPDVHPDALILFQTWLKDGLPDDPSVAHKNIVSWTRFYLFCSTYQISIRHVTETEPNTETGTIPEPHPVHISQDVLHRLSNLTLRATYSWFANADPQDLQHCYRLLKALPARYLAVHAFWNFQKVPSPAEHYSKLMSALKLMLSDRAFGHDFARWSFMIRCLRGSNRYGRWHILTHRDSHLGRHPVNLLLRWMLAANRITGENEYGTKMGRKPTPGPERKAGKGDSVGGLESVPRFEAKFVDESLFRDEMGADASVPIMLRGFLDLWGEEDMVVRRKTL